MLRNIEKLGFGQPDWKAQHAFAIEIVIADHPSITVE
jgi:hypothetical protein